MPNLGLSRCRLPLLLLLLTAQLEGLQRLQRRLRCWLDLGLLVLHLRRSVVGYELAHTVTEYDISPKKTCCFPGEIIS